MLRMRSVPNRNTKNWPLWFTFFKQRRIWSFHVPVLQKTAKKCTKIYNARAQLLICSLNLFLDEVLLTVDVVVCLIKLRISGDGESIARVDSSVPMIHRDLDRSWITDPDPNYQKKLVPLDSQAK